MAASLKDEHSSILANNYHVSHIAGGVIVSRSTCPPVTWSAWGQSRGSKMYTNDYVHKFFGEIMGKNPL